MKNSYSSALFQSLLLACLSGQALAQSEYEVVEATRERNSQQPIFIVNKNDSKAASIQEQESTATSQNRVYAQPTTVISANPIRDSRADEVRRARQDSELETELKIVEKLEESRLRDERRRAKRLFGDRLNTRDDEGGSDDYGYEERAPKKEVRIIEVQAAPAPVQASEPKDLLQTAVVKEKVDQDYYGILNFGFSEYPDVANVRSNISLGAMLGIENKKIRFEGMFNYAQSELIDVRVLPARRVLDVDHFMFGATTKFVFGKGMVRPYVGGSIVYVYRNYQDQNSFGGSQGTASSHAFDIGPVAGVDVEITKDFSVMSEFRYSTNIYNQVNASFQNPMFINQGFVGTPLEMLDYYQLMFGLKYTFE